MPKTPALSSDSDSLTELGDIDEDPPNPDFTGSSAPPASTRRTSRNVERIDYRKAHTGRAFLNKTNSSVLINFPHSAANQAIRDYVLSPESHIQHKSTPIKGFVRIARKKAKTSTPDEPSLKDAMASSEADEWKRVMEIEYEALLANGTWELVDRPSHQHVLTGKWAFKRKRDINGQVKRHKARWVGRGFEQREGVDYFETFAAVVKASTNKALFAITAHKKLHSHQLDAVTAFLNSCLDTEVYIEQPEMFHNRNYGQVLRLCRGLYGLKQSARLWFDLFTEEMLVLGFYQSKYDSALFLDGKGTYVAIYVDDLQIIGPDFNVIEELKTRLSQRFKMTDLGPTSHYLGMEVHLSKGAVTITQKTYVESLLDSHQMSDCNPSATPMVEGSCLKPAGPDFAPDPANVTAYKKFTGSAQWLACQTRPDIIQTVAKLSQQNVKPTEECWKAVVHMPRYLKGTKGRGIRYAEGNLIPFGYSDSSWTNDIFDRKSTAGYLFILNGGPISWASRKQPTVSTSTCEAEYIAQTEAACEAVWIRGLLGELGVLRPLEEESFLKTIAPPTVIFADNQGAIKLTSNPEYH